MLRDLEKKRVENERKRLLRYRPGYKILFYAEIIAASMKRYHEFLKTLEVNA